jgi:plastocyanin
MRRAAVLTVAAVAAVAAPAPVDAAHGPRHHGPRHHGKRHHGAVKRGGLRFEAPRVKDATPKPKPPTVKPLPTPPDESPPITPPQTFPTTRLSVRADEYSLTLSSNPVAAGDALVELANAGEDAHNIRIVPRGDDAHPLATFPVTPAAARSKVRFKLPAGSYEIYCTVLDHRARGMDAVLTVR